MTELVDSRCKDCRSKSFQCTPCSNKDVTVRKQIVQARKAQVVLSKYQLFEFPAMPPPAPLVANGQVLYPPPATSPIKRLRDEFSMSDDEVALKKPAAPEKPAAKVAQLPQAAVVQVAVTPKKSAAQVAQLPPAAVDSPPVPQLKKPAAPKKSAAKVAQLPQAAVVQVAVTPKKPAAKVVDADEGSSSSSETCSDSESEDNNFEDEDDEIVVGKGKEEGKEVQKTPKMAKITLVERNVVVEWCSKERKDKKMNNARWIRNGGAKGSSMTATSGEVRTSGAYEALAT
jgi:hypothetical protein